MKGPITIDVLEKGATVNSTSYCQLDKQNLPYLLNNPSLINKVIYYVCFSITCHPKANRIHSTQIQIFNLKVNKQMTSPTPTLLP